MTTATLTFYSSTYKFLAVTPYLGMHGEMIESMFEYLPDPEHSLNNCTVKGVEGTLRTIPWSGDGKYTVGEVIGEPNDEKDLILNPRFIAKRQLAKLEESGYKLMSAFEMEQVFLDGETMKPLFEGSDYHSSFVMFKHEKLLFDIKEKMAAYGIPITSMINELSTGQFEFTMKPSYGIDCADQCFLGKEALKEICHQHGVVCTYMTSTFKDAMASGYHFNHSLWTTAGEAAFHSKLDKNKMSQLARFWIGGLQHHARGMTALLCPTVNCYHRLNDKWGIKHNGWAVGDSMHTFRMKTGDPEDTYLENRLPSSASNPYLVLAATIAAGLDGIQKKIEPIKPDWTRQGLQELPLTLGEALEALENDDVIVNAVGQEFVHIFSLIKRHHEMVEMDGIDMSKKREEDFERERAFYL